MKTAYAAAFLCCILAANYVTTEFGMVPVGFGLVATAGTYLAGLSFILRDSVQDAFGKRWAVALIALGAGLSYLIADPFIALASGVVSTKAPAMFAALSLDRRVLHLGRGAGTDGRQGSCDGGRSSGSGECPCSTSPTRAGVRS